MFFQDDDNHVPIVGVVLSVVLATVAVIVGVAITGSPAPSQGSATTEAAANAAPTAPNSDEARVEIQGNVFKFYFASGKSDLAANAPTALQQIAQALKSGHSADISGYHDATGSAALNADLAKRRALTVRDGLLALGVPADRITLEKPEAALGGANPAEARRVEVVVK